MKWSQYRSKKSVKIQLNCLITSWDTILMIFVGFKKSWLFFQYFVLGRSCEIWKISSLFHVVFGSTSIFSERNIFQKVWNKLHIQKVSSCWVRKHKKIFFLKKRFSWNIWDDFVKLDFATKRGDFFDFQNACPRKWCGHFHSNSSELKYFVVLQTGRVSASVLIATPLDMTCGHRQKIEISVMG